jgi:hypothetical protein
MQRMAVLALAVVAAAGVGPACTGESDPLAASAAAPPLAAAAPPLATGVHGLFVARPFRLAEPYANRWRADGGAIRSGWLVVLEVDRALVEPRSELEPVLYAGDSVVERINHGHASGHVIGVVPGAAPLDATPFWFGEPGLPERVTAASLARERVAAERAGVRAFGAEELAAARARGGDPLELADHGALRREAARLIRAWSPEERELAEGILAPPVR